MKKHARILALLLAVCMMLEQRRPEADLSYDPEIGRHDHAGL